MKKSIFFTAFIALILANGFVFFNSGCDKADNLQTLAQPAAGDANVVGTIDRGPGCCCDIVVSSTYYGGMSLCGITNGTDNCGPFCTTCGWTDNMGLTWPIGKNHTFCINPGKPFSITNIGIAPIQIWFSCNGGAASSATWIPAPGGLVSNTVYFTNDCGDETVQCDPATNCH